MKTKLIFYHFKRDLRLNDNAGFYHALKQAQEYRSQGYRAEVLSLFVFDQTILKKLSFKNDRRVNFIYQRVLTLKMQLQAWGSDLLVLYGPGAKEIQSCALALKNQYETIDYYGNFDDDPYPLQRDKVLKEFFIQQGGKFRLFKDHLIFARREILNQSQNPYTVFTPYKKAWMEKLQDSFYRKSFANEKYKQFLKKGILQEGVTSLKELGFESTQISSYLEFNWDQNLILSYQEKKDFPSLSATSLAGVHLRFGTISSRELISFAWNKSESFISEIAWRDFFAQILFHYPHVVKKSFKESFEKVPWRNEVSEFERWKEGMTGYPLVDAGMRELIATGFISNRVRMVTASFLCKHLLHHWHLGERWFASLLIDYDLAANNGNWQWCAGSGCDAAPYFRIFSPMAQQKKFDPNWTYIKKWVPELGTSRYPSPMVNHEQARARALQAFKEGLKR